MNRKQRRSSEKKRKNAEKAVANGQTLGTAEAQDIIQRAFATATELHQQGNVAKASELYIEILKEDPHHPGALHHLGLIESDKNNLEDGKKLIEHALHVQPSYHQAWNSLGTVERKLKNYDAAIACYDNALDLKPDYVDSYVNRGNIHWENMACDLAVADYKKALDMAPDCPLSHLTYSNLAQAYRDMGLTEKAMACFEEAARRNPDDIRTYQELGSLATQYGDNESSLGYFYKALELDPDNANAYYQITNTKKFTDENDPILKAMEMLDQKSKQVFHTKDWLVYLNFALAKAYFDLKKPEKAFEKFAYANQLKHHSYDLDNGFMDDYFNAMDRITELFTKETLDKYQDAAFETKKPIFIVGMPRSGTTLTEQILFSHPDVYGGGELTHMGRAVARFLGNTTESTNPVQETETIFRNLNTESLKQVGGAYLKGIEEISEGALHVTDKMPFNFFWVGLIKTIFPNARIIHTNRDPMATCFSCYQKNFTGHIFWCYDQENLGHYYQHYKKLMDHWTSLYGDDIYQLEYEKLVENQEEETRKLLEYCELPWDDACLRFYETQRTVRTASKDQVRQPMYKGSLQAWRKHEKYLGDLIKALGTYAPQDVEIYPNPFADIFDEKTISIDAPNAVSAAEIQHESEKQTLIEKTLQKAKEIASYEWFEQALSILDQLLIHAPDNPRIFYNIGLIHEQKSDYIAARDWMTKAVELKPDYAPGWSGLASVALDMRDFDKVVDYSKKSIDMAPNNAHIHVLAGNLMSLMGRMDDALPLYQKAKALNPNEAHAHHNLTIIKKLTKEDPDFIDLEKMSHDDLSNLPRDDQILLEFAMGKAFHDVKDYDKAFLHYKKGNDMKDQSLPFRPGFYELYYDKITKIFDQNILEKFKDLGDPSKKPIFIVGMPRSGTTLLDQIFDAHPDVFGGGELVYFQNSVPFFPNPDIPDHFRQDQATLCENLVQNLSPELIKGVGQSYLQHINELAPNAPHVTDKMPTNYIWVGLIKLALPNAKIIHAKRDPVATCLSCYRQLFTQYQPWSYNLVNLGKMYKSYHQLITYWQNLLGDDMYEIEYENVVNDFETEVRNLLNYCDLPWHDGCLEFYKSERKVKTASVAQVRQPIYKDSTKGWKKYEQHLGPLLEELGDLV